MMQQHLIPHLFRTEYRKIVSVLGRLFGIGHIEIAEDIVSETFLLAVEVWTYQGLPENPTGWLYGVAKNKAKNYLNRDRIFSEKVAERWKEQQNPDMPVEIDLSEKNITDSQLQMLFALCHPSIPAEAQIGLSLRILCGFGIEEIADAFLTSRETIHKRLSRAREKLRAENVAIVFPPQEEISKRLDAVLSTLYLLFNEGYYSESRDEIVRNDLCLEAMRLAYLLIENENTATPAVYALLALMCFHASRFEARKDNNGEIVLYDDQDAQLWNYELISRGAHFLRDASRGNEMSRYHLEASIAYWHTVKADSDGKWSSILQLYNQLLIVAYSPIAALNRTYALSKVRGKQAAIAETEKLDLQTNHFYFTLLGELYLDSDNEKAQMYFEKAFSLAKSQKDKNTIRKKMEQLG